MLNQNLIYLRKISMTMNCLIVLGILSLCVKLVYCSDSFPRINNFEQELDGLFQHFVSTDPVLETKRNALASRFGIKCEEKVSIFLDMKEGIGKISVKLSEDVFFNVMSYLDINYFMSVLLVSKNFRKLGLAYIKDRFLYQFPHISLNSLNYTQISHFDMAAQLLRRIYPSFNIEGISSAKEIATLLELSFLVSCNSDKIVKSEDIPTLSKLLAFLKIFRPNLSKLASLSKHTTLKVPFKMFCLCKRSDELRLVMDTIIQNGHSASFDILIDLNLLTTDNLSNFAKEISECPSYYILNEIFRRIKNIYTLETIQELVLKQFDHRDNPLILRAYLDNFGLDLEKSVLDLQFIKTLILKIFINGLARVFEELITNPISAQLIQNKPHLLKLPNEYLESFKDCNGFLKVYLESPYFAINPDPDSFITRSLNNYYNAFFAELLQNEKYQIRSDMLKEIIKKLSEMTRLNWKAEAILYFWKSPKIYKAFCYLTPKIQSEIIKQIVKKPDFYHLFGLLHCGTEKKDLFFEAIRQQQEEVEVGNHLNYYELFLLRDDFYLNPIADDENFIYMFFFLAKSCSFTGDVLLHSLFKSLCHEKYKLFEPIVEFFTPCELFTTELFKILISLFEREVGILASYAQINAFQCFWRSTGVREMLKGFDETQIIDTIKSIINLRKCKYLITVFDMNSEILNTISHRFDLIDYCLKAGYTSADMSNIWYHRSLIIKLQLPEIYAKYKDNTAFMDFIKPKDTQCFIDPDQMDWRSSFNFFTSNPQNPDH